MTADDPLARLETAVREASEALAGLRRKNLTLKRRIRQLEESPAARGRAGAPAAWREERARLKKRVERLAADLERLLD